MAATPTPHAPSPPSFVPGAVRRSIDEDAKRETSTNAWTDIIASATDHPDEHLTKVRSRHVQAHYEKGRIFDKVFCCCE
jgi:hypothetical protein